MKPTWRMKRPSIPSAQAIGVQLGKVLPVAGQPMRFSLNPQYDLKDLPGNSRFTVLFNPVAAPGEVMA